MTGVIYARYSEGPRQTDQSIEGQVADCKAYAERNDIDIIEIYADCGISGKSVTGRHEFQRMMYDAEHHRFDCVIVWKIDRFGRSREDIAVSKMQLKKAGVELRYAVESVPAGPEGIILESLLEGLAEYYSVELSQKIKRGIRESAKKGRYSGAPLPIGYMLDDEKHVIVNEQEAEAVREAFRMHIAGARTTDIIEMLTARGIRGPRTGKPVTPSSVYRLLRNHRYCGDWELAGIPLNVPGIISEETFMKAAKNFKTSRNNAAGTAKTDYLLSCRCYCAYCGSMLIGESGTGKHGKVYHYYKCSGQKHKKTNCELKPIPQADLEDAVLHAVNEDMLTPEMIERVTDKILEIQEADEEGTFVQSLKEDLKDTEKRRERILKAIEVGGALTSLTERLAQLDREIEKLKLKIKEEDIKKPRLTRDIIKFWLTTFRDGDLSDPEWRYRLVHTFISHVDVRNGEALIVFNVTGEGSTTFRQVDLKAWWSNKPTILFGRGLIILRVAV